jgi:hypothetical protein
MNGFCFSWLFLHNNLNMNFLSFRNLFVNIFLFLFVVNISIAQNVTISGTIKDANNGEQLIDVIVQVEEQKSIATTTNEYGFYSLTLKPGTYTINYTYLGYNTIAEKVTLNANLVKNIKLSTVGKELGQVVVTATAKNENIKSTNMGMEKLNMAQIKDVPVLFGERDVMKTLQLLPGVKSSGDGGSGFFVRGGAADQNLIILDEATVYNASHLLGFFSTFNSDAIKDVTLYKGNMPAQYGGRLASVMDVKMNDGNNQNYEVSGGIGLIASRLMLQGPIKKNKGSFLISGRRTYADMFLKLSSNPDQRNNKLYFYDLNMKGNYEFGEKDRLYVSGYFGKDVIGVGNLFGIDWGNATGTVRWNHIFNSKLFSNTSLIYSNYNYNIGVKIVENDFKIISKIKDWNLKQEFQWFPNSNNKVKFGINSIHHTIVPGEIRASGTSGVNNLALEKRYGWENAAYINNDWKVSPRLNISYGIRLSAYSVLGPGTYYNQFDQNGQPTDSTMYKSGEFGKTYINPEPRLSASFVIDEANSIKGAYARNTQSMHLLSNTTASSPTDRWIPNSNIIKPEIADQFSLGYYKNFKDNTYETSIEGYYKDMKNQLDYRDGARIEGNSMVEADLLFGIGRAYGAEFSLKKKEGKLTGWVSYTLSRVEKKIDGINKNDWYVARQDQTHNLAVVAIYKLTPKWTLSGTFVYNTGNAVTFPSGKYEMNGTWYYQYTERNGYRMPAYHRLDIGATCKLRDTKKYTSELALSVYNAYGRQNAYIINFRQNPDNLSETQAVQYSLFRFVPSISWNFSFK